MMGSTAQEQLIADHVRGWHVPGEMLIVGLCGPQASGKSTECASVATLLQSEGLRVAELSPDDLYLSRKE